uniref:LysM domain-containing protein n=1 Tax=Clastoptera arizonana TaxID=38151 RepID=A0A1B6DDI0_9HEMI
MSFKFKRMDETLSIRESAKYLKKYGSTSKILSKKPEHYLKHHVSKSDTLQGIALKYGVTTEQIRRANRLWTNDSLFLKETLLVPVPIENATTDMKLTDNATLLNLANNNSQVADSDSSYNDFLVKIDTSIANTKSQVMLAQGNSDGSYF